MLGVKITIDQCSIVHCGQPPSVFFITYLSSLLFNANTSWLRSDIGVWQKLTTISSHHLAKIFKKQKKITSFSTISLLQASFCQIPIFRIKSLTDLFPTTNESSLPSSQKKSEKPWRCFFWKPRSYWSMFCNPFQPSMWQQFIQDIFRG